MASLPDYLTVDELAALLRRSRATILQDRWRNPGAVPPAIKLGKTLLWDVEAVKAWLARQTEPPREPPPLAEAQPRRRGRPRKSL